jgi:hypothetical protein
MQTRPLQAKLLRLHFQLLYLSPWQQPSMRDAARDVGEEDSVIVVVVGVTVNVDNIVNVSASVSASATAGDCLMSRGQGLFRRQVQIAQHWVRA